MESRICHVSSIIYRLNVTGTMNAWEDLPMNRFVRNDEWYTQGATYTVQSSANILFHIVTHNLLYICAIRNVLTTKLQQAALTWPDARCKRDLNRLNFRTRKCKYTVCKRTSGAKKGFQLVHHWRIGSLMAAEAQVITVHSVTYMKITFCSKNPHSYTKHKLQKYILQPQLPIDTVLI